MEKAAQKWEEDLKLEMGGLEMGEGIPSYL